MTQWVSACVGLGVSLAILFFIRRDRLLVRHGLGWILVAFVVMVVGLFPGLVDFLASWAGVAYPPSIAMVSGFGALIIKALISDIELSRAEVKMTRLMQRLAILESEISLLQSSDSASSRSKPQ